ncbi:TRAP transporter large permease [Salicibibacter cibi]|uniref:TRAP transporter large permease n=1 Tax=Salicibibacter cibi TaxID=2743001 RepID=A0A7T7CEB9_9BACI|nr:TRAP transporter large permease [Salicibibacter cibi]QQK78860.1 TRAP transporter large permease [Salicibibacter cibi]
MTTRLFIIFIFLFILSVPIAATLGLSSIWSLQLEGSSLSTVGQQVFRGMDQTVLMAIPFFILAGSVMQSGGIARRLMAFANALIGWFRGGLGAATVLSTMLFSTMSGSSSATTAAIGSITIPSMEKKGYPRSYATALAASAGELGGVIPPATAMIIYGLVANISISSLFIAGIIPGILIGISLILTISIIARIKGFDAVSNTDFITWFKQVLVTFKDAIWALLMPLIILGGIYLGYFTPTEAAVVAVVYGLIVSFLIYRELKIKDLIGIFSRAAISSSIILILIGFSAIFGHILTINQVPHAVGGLLTQITENPIIFLILVNIVLLITGMFLETAAAIIIMVPILAPVAFEFGIDPIHFGIIVIVNLALGMVTPPVAINLFVACQIANIRIDQIIRPVLIFLGILIIDLLLITYLPLWIPIF